MKGEGTLSCYKVRLVGSLGPERPCVLSNYVKYIFRKFIILVIWNKGRQGTELMTIPTNTKVTVKTGK